MVDNNQQDYEKLHSTGEHTLLKEWVEPTLEIYPAHETATGLPGPGDGGGAYS